MKLTTTGKLEYERRLEEIVCRLTENLNERELESRGVSVFSIDTGRIKVEVQDDRENQVPNAVSMVKEQREADDIQLGGIVYQQQKMSVQDAIAAGKIERWMF